MDVSNMTLEGFFLTDYQRLRERVRELEAEVSRLDNGEYGCIDQHQTCDAVRVSVARTYDIRNLMQYGMTIDQLREAHAMTDDGLLEWASKTYKDSSYGILQPIIVERHTYQYTLTFNETRGCHTYVTDGQEDSRLVNIDLMEDEMADNLGHWCREGHLEDLKLAAVSELREVIGRVIDDAEKQEQQ